MAWGNKTMGETMKTISCFAWGEAGEMSIEYGLFTALMAVVVITVLAAIGTNLTTKFNDLATRMTSACMIGVNVGTRPPGCSL